MENIIKINKIKLYAYHGCLEEEAKIGGNYEINVVLHTDFLEASTNDDLEKTINYVDVNRIVQNEMAIRSKLIEHVGQRIITKLKGKFNSLSKCSVEIIKLCPPINGDVESVSILITE
jgi:dihydroneopterin aldolase